MTPTQVQELLVQANRAAGRGDWRSTYEALKSVNTLDPQNPGVLSGLGRCMIQLGQPEDSIAYFQDAADLAPDSPEAYNNLGVAYSLNGQLEEARLAYLKALDLNTHQPQVWKNLALILLQTGEWEEGVQFLVAVIQADPGDAEARFMLGQCYEAGEDFESARFLYKEVLNSQPEHEGARQALARLPLAAADPVRIARPEHARKLAALKGLQNKSNGAQKPAEKARPLPAAFYGPAEAATEVRLGPAIKTLTAQGAQVKVGLKLDPQDLETYTTFVFFRPNASQELIEGLQRCKQAGKRVLVDLDLDFLRYPMSYLGYEQFGSGNPAAMQRLEEALVQADMVTVPSKELAERYKRYNPHVEVIPFSWDRTNRLWDKPAPARSTVNLGLFGTHIRPQDAAQVKGVVDHILKEFPHTLLVAAVDLGLFSAFSDIPEDRRIFLPPGRLDDYPSLLAEIDILLVPLEDNPFNQALGDLPLLEAGLRGIPWVASRIPAFEAWGVGGTFAADNKAWFAAIAKLVKDPDLRKLWGDEGREKAEERQVMLVG